jgi:hypothetical protein
MDDATKQTFPEFKPQPPMFEGTAEPAQMPTPPETGKAASTQSDQNGTGRKKRQYTRRQPAGKIPAKPEPAKQRKGKPRGARRVMPATVSSISEQVKETGRKRAKTARPLMVPIGLLPELGGMKTEDASLLMSIIGNLQTTNKRSRTKIVAALGKLFA